MFRPTIDTAVRGDPDALLLVEFAEEDQDENLRRLKQLGEMMADLGFGWDQPKRNGAAWSRSSSPRCRPASPISARPASTS